MKYILILISSVALLLTIVPSIFFFMGRMEMDPMKLWMGVGMVAWMVTAPFWINKKQEEGQPEAGGK
jgi:hypothetical protein